MCCVPYHRTDSATIHVASEPPSGDRPLLLVSDCVFRNVCPAAVCDSCAKKHAVEDSHDDGGDAFCLLQLPRNAEWRAVWNRGWLFDDMAVGLLYLGRCDSPCAGCEPVSAFILDSTLVLVGNFDCLHGERVADCIPS